MAPAKKNRGTVEMRVGSVTVEVVRPSRDEIRRNIKAGQEALARALPRLLRPGVKLKMPDNVPLYHADPDNVDLMIRKLGKTLTKGRFVDGEFRAANINI